MMGLSLDTVQLRGASVAQALDLATDALRAEGWRVVDAPGPRTAQLAAIASGDWVSLFLPRRATRNTVAHIAQASTVPGIHLFVADSDYWGGTLFHAGAIARRFDNRLRPPGARTLRRQIAATLAIDVPEASLAAVLASTPTFAEDSLADFARLLALRNVLGLPDKPAASVLLEWPVSAQEAQMEEMLDMRAFALVLAPAPGFGSAAMALLTYLAQQLNGGQLGPRSIVVEAGRIERFTLADLPVIATRLNAGGIASVDASFNGIAFSCARYGAAGRYLQIVATSLLTVTGELAYPDSLGLLDPPAPLLAHLFEAPHPTLGLIEPVSSSAALAAEDLRSLLAWPPVAHWVTYLAPAQAHQLDSASIDRAMAEGWQRVPANDGTLLARLALPAHQSRNRAGRQARLALTAALAGLPAPPLA